MIAAEVVVEDGDVGLGGADHLPHAAELGPGAGVEDQEQVDRGERLRRRLFKVPEDPFGVEEAEVGRQVEGIRRGNLLAQLPEHVVHAQLAPHGVAIGSMVSRQEDIPLGADKLNESRPVDLVRTGRVRVWSCHARAAFLLLECGRGQPAAGG